MQEINNKTENESVRNNDERRFGDRRRKHRRVSDGVHNGIDRRLVDSDRRITIVNRLNVEVTDRRTIN
ncbi:MAG: hypothetical protein JW864_00995 [Spirochaetes bacterium]|nr:hypothetical protein [Spirochaetota bacterium]